MTHPALAVACPECLEKAGAPCRSLAMKPRIMPNPHAARANAYARKPVTGDSADDREAIGRWIRMRRTAMGMTVAQLAAAAGISRSQLENYEKGNSSLLLEANKRLVAYLRRDEAASQQRA